MFSLLRRIFQFIIGRTRKNRATNIGPPGAELDPLIELEAEYGDIRVAIKQQRQIIQSACRRQEELSERTAEVISLITQIKSRK